jgi:hypothetical protein
MEYSRDRTISGDLPATRTSRITSWNPHTRERITNILHSKCTDTCKSTNIGGRCGRNWMLRGYFGGIFIFADKILRSTVLTTFHVGVDALGGLNVSTD